MKVYERVYNYFVEQIETGKLLQGEKMPSLRMTEKQMAVSRTSVETAYMMLAADGYIFSKEKAGFYVTDMVARNRTAMKTIEKESMSTETVVYDFATIREDESVSCLSLWRRYMKSALRQEERLLSYSKNQGEDELRREIALFVRKSRNIICNEEDIVIGAGFQSLLQVLIPLIEGEKSVSFPTKNYKDGATTFKDAGYEVSYRNKESHVLYVIPAYMTKWGDVMNMKRRREIIEHAQNENHLIIEDDYQNEFVFSSQATPSLYALTGGENVAYLGSFSRVLLPSVRISFLILPKGYMQRYQDRKELYNQTASKAEQIALAQFLRDGHMLRHIRKMRRLYEEKRQVMLLALKNTFGDHAEILLGDSGMEIGLVLKDDSLDKKAIQNGISIISVEKNEDKSMYLLSCSGISIEKIAEGIAILGVKQQ